MQDARTPYRAGRARFAVVACILLALSGCGRAPFEPLAAQSATGAAVVGLGAEGGERPALLRRAAGRLVLAYAGTNVGDRHVYLRTADDGLHFGEPTAIAPGAFADQAPTLAEDGAGRLHLFFVSNRSGETQGVYHVAEQGAGWTDAAPIDGFEGAQDLAVACGPAGFTLVAEVMGAGLLVAESRDGAAWSAPGELAPAGAEPGATLLPDGRAAVAYQADGRILVRAGRPGVWSEPIEAASGATRLRDPALGWGAAGGMLAYAERVDGRFVLRARRFGDDLRFEDGEAPDTSGADARGPALSLLADGVPTFAWGMKNANGQQGVMVTTR